GYTLGLLHGLDFEIIYANHDVYKNEGSPADVLEIKTFYENQYLEKGKPITYIQFRITN
ncbi:MAG: tRNA (guanosine(46)-N7)-methyltransferase TrmB, partial [Croceitalea sp.]|nr:tRNA (guanosine(46)-N7)-methyltransferase TrmB [Croceitalea sp.]